jgi:hypothetical protein
MKRTIFLLATVLCLILSEQVQAQRYLRGQRGIQFIAGPVNGININTKRPDFAFYTGVAFSRYTKKGNHWVFGGEYLEKRHPYKNWSIPQMQITGEGGYYLGIVSDGEKTFFFSVGASALAGYETVNRNKKLLPDGATVDNKDALIYGAALTFETKIYITDRLVFLINARQRVLMGSSVGEFNSQPGAGFKFIIN